MQKNTDDQLAMALHDLQGKTVTLSAKPSRIKVVTLESVKQNMVETFTKGKARGETTHFESIDPHFTWKKDSLICLTGYPGHGKTELILNLMLAKSVHSGWRWALYCPENMPADEIYDSLIHSYIGKSTDKTFQNYMLPQEYTRGMKFIGDHFILIDPDNPNLETVLENFKYLIEMGRIDGCLIDPWNQLVHEMEAREDIYLSNQLLKAKRFCKDQNIVMVISAHPTKPHVEKGQLPTPTEHSLSGGSMWNNKVDIILVVHRPSYYTDPSSKDVELHSRKIKKQKLVGIPGIVNLTFHRPSNRYHEKNGNTPLQHFDVCAKKESGYLKSLGL